MTNIFKFFDYIDKTEGFTKALFTEYTAFSMFCEGRATFEAWAEDMGIDTTVTAKDGKNYVDVWAQKFISYIEPI